MGVAWVGLVYFMSANCQHSLRAGVQSSLVTNELNMLVREASGAEVSIVMLLLSLRHE